MLTWEKNYLEKTINKGGVSEHNAFFLQADFNGTRIS